MGIKTKGRFGICFYGRTSCQVCKATLSYYRTMSKKKRLLSGIQPTGKLHLGNYLGAISNWVDMQDEYDAFYAIVDLHSLTTVYENPAALRKDKEEIAMDLLACGVRFERRSRLKQRQARNSSGLIELQRGAGLVVHACNHVLALRAGVPVNIDRVLCHKVVFHVLPFPLG